MWKSGWNLDREWVKRNEKWLILLVLGLAILILYAPFGKKTIETGVWQSGERWAESGTGTNAGNRAGQDKNGSSSQGGKIGSVDSSDGDNRNGDGLADGGQSLTGHRDGLCFGWTWKYSAGTEIIGSGFFCFQGLGNGFGGYAENLVRSQLGAHLAGGQVTLTDMDAVGAAVYGDVEAVIDNQRNVIALGEFADGKRLP